VYQYLVYQYLVYQYLVYMYLPFFAFIYRDLLFLLLYWHIFLAFILFV